jgi:hypothetical protein
LTRIVDVPSEGERFAQCDACAIAGRARAIVSLSGDSWQWDDLRLWQLRRDAKRVFAVLVKARQTTTEDTRDDVRQAVNAQVATWFGRAELGPWTTWSAADCRALFTHAETLVASYSDALVTGSDRTALHVITARRAALPRLTFLALRLRDRMRARWARMIARWPLGRTPRPNDER